MAENSINCFYPSCGSKACAPIKQFGAVSTFKGINSGPEIGIAAIKKVCIYTDTVHIGTSEVLPIGRSRGRQGLRDQKQSGRRQSKSEKPKRTAQRSRLTLFDQRDTFVAVIVIYINILGY